MTEFEQLQIEQLKRIADVLEDINGTLIDMSTPVEQLAECVGVHPARYGVSVSVLLPICLMYRIWFIWTCVPERRKRSVCMMLRPVKEIS